MSRVILEFKVGEESQASRFIALHCIGLLVSFRDNYIPFGDVEGFFLSRMVRKLPEQGLDARLVELVCLGCDVVELKVVTSAGVVTWRP